MSASAARKIVTVVGARPQFVKAAAVSRALAQKVGIAERIVHTGQHFDANMSSVFFDELGIPAPAHHLDIHGLDHGLGHGAMTGRMLEALESVLLEERPDAVMVYGDTNSTLAGALAAAKLHIPIAHVEAGLRSFNRRMPEEINRVIADHVSALLFCPTKLSVRNLKDEGITAGVHQVGDVMYDATLHARGAAVAGTDVLTRLGLSDAGYGLATLHRAENTDDPARFTKMIGFLEAEARTRPIVFPVHPRTRAVLERLKLTPLGLRLIDPVGYLDMHALLAGAVAVYTDSGGLQKEAYFHRVPCVTLRDETEWTETIEAGWNRLWTAKRYAPRRAISDYGDGTSGAKIADLLLAGTT